MAYQFIPPPIERKRRGFDYNQRVFDPINRGLMMLALAQQQKQKGRRDREEMLSQRQREKLEYGDPSLMPSPRFPSDAPLRDTSNLPQRLRVFRPQEGGVPAFETAKSIREQPVLSRRALGTKLVSSVLADEPRRVSTPVFTQEQALERGAVPAGAKIVKAQDPEFGELSKDLKRARAEYYQERAEDVTEQQEERRIRRSEREKRRWRQYRLDIEQRDPVIKEINKQDLSMRAVDRLNDLVKKGNTVAFSGLGTKMARGMGEVGVLTEEDIKRYVRSGMITRKTADTLMKWSIGRPTQATLSELGEITAAIRQSWLEKGQPRIDSYIKFYADLEGLSPRETADKLKLHYGGISKGGGGEEQIKKVRGNTYIKRGGKWYLYNQ